MVRKINETKLASPRASKYPPFLHTHLQPPHVVSDHHVCSCPMHFTCMVIIRCVVLLWISSYEVGDKCVAAWHHNDAPWDNTSKCVYILLFMTKRPQICASLRQTFQYKI